MKALISKPVNDLQRQFNELCEKGGGVKGGPVRGKTLELLKFYGQTLNQGASEEIQEHLAAFPDANPWHVCFALGLCWGHLAKVDLTFTEAAIGALEHINDDDLKTAGSFCLERGPEPIINSLRGGHALFQRVMLPSTLPDTLDRMDRAQQRWLTPIVHPTDRPPYIGSWNATAMFMTALFANPALAATQMEPKPVLPPGGPIFTGLSLLHQAGLLPTPPDTADIDGKSFEPGVLYTNNGLLQSLLAGCTGWSMTDVHSGVYLLGTRHHESDSWIKAKTAAVA
ncbi:hypothetical protein [Brevundimonas sp.]|uniref:hypothetical protein n=1 Tax=Brevundimonas sp. TaxID=1871086 RepID=UPI001D8C35EC|nr:hypothetical protein [Brevundimonas sp.]MBL0947584.1 hypothetical protein [Brevundimonas sp.]